MESVVYVEKEVRELLQLSRSACYAAIKDGRIPSIRINGKILIPKAAVARLLAEAEEPRVPANSIDE